jgi:Arylsulfotransferase (ASST)
MLGNAYKVAFVLALCFLCFMWGLITPFSRTFPYGILINSIRGSQAWIVGRRYADPYQAFSWVKPRPSKEGFGVTRYDPERAYNGYTLFTAGHTQGAFLIDMRGKIVHEWHLPYREVWNREAAVKNPVPPNRIYLRRAYLYPDGNLLAIYVAAGVTPWGYGLVKMDPHSRPIWAYLDHAHHDMAVGPDGKIYTLVQKIRKVPFPDLPNVPLPAIEDFVVVLSPDGKPLRRISVYEAFARSRYRSAMNLITEWNLGDQIHTNAIKIVTQDIAKRFPFTHVGEVLLSFRNIDAIALLDLTSEKIVWFLSGPWRRQHDPEFLPNGHMLIFDNEGDLARGGESRVLEFDPNDLEIFWQYPSRGGGDFDSAWQGTVQQLPNGNILITESDNARLLEVTRDKKIVWQYRSPLGKGPQKDYPALICGGHRFGPQELHFDFNGGHVAGDAGSHRALSGQENGSQAREERGEPRAQTN